ncbi:hypothetical protein PG994_008072 [Apiospora phragmitis]|uniref:Uncharacterized protein n=1 Tax=Apiospora phragmitis TaxID=2905665 RepID=A0ABR1US02_9PEZI
MSFQFITSINTIDRDAETRRRVRSHARRQKLTTTDSSSEQAPSAKSGSTSQKDRTSKFRLGTPTAAASKKAAPKGSRKHASPVSLGSNEEISTPSSGTSGDVILSADPASATTLTAYSGQMDMITNELGYMIIRELPLSSALPIQTTPMTENLFRYMLCVCLSPKEKFVQKWFDRCGAPSYFTNYHSSFLAHSHSMNPGGDLLDFLAVDPAMTHAFMGFMAAMHNALADWDDSSTVDFHRQETIQSINTRLSLESKGQDVPVSDSVIVSVSLLVNIESFIGSESSARAHMNGLIRMVELRGGLIDGLGYSPLLQRALCWADFAYATMAAVPLSFPMVPQISGPLDIQDRFMSRSMMINNGVRGRHHGRHSLLILDREASELFELLFSTTEAVNNFEFARIDALKEQRSQMSDTVYLLEYRLCAQEEQARARAAQLGNNTAALANRTDLSEPLVYASHLFLHLALRGQPPAAKRHKALTEALMTSISGLLIHLGWLFGASSDSSPPASYSTTDAPGAQAYTSAGDWPSSSYQETAAFHGHGPDMPVAVKLELENVESEAVIDDLHDDILLWILFVGCCVQMRPQYPRNEYGIPTLDSTFLARDHRPFFVLALRRLCRERAISEKEVLIDRLRTIVWMNTWCERQLDMVWALLGLELEL